MRIAIVGTGISGLVCAHLLSRRHDVTVFEADGRPGGHAHTVRVDLPDETHEVDTGFIVYNERNYPGLIRLFDRLGVATKPSDMSFSVSDEVSGLEWRGTSLGALFAQRRNLVRPAFLRMLIDVVRFNRAARPCWLRDQPAPVDRWPTSLADGHWSPQFVDWYLVPLGSSIWSADPSTFLDIPAVTFARFLDNHGLLEYGNRPRGARSSAARSGTSTPSSPRWAAHPPGLAGGQSAPGGIDGVELLSDMGPERFDHVVLATPQRPGPPPAVRPDRRRT